MKNGLMRVKSTPWLQFVVLFVFLSTSPGPGAYAGWQIDIVEDSRLYRSASLKVDVGGAIHVAYGHDHLYYARFAGGTWAYQTVDTARGVGDYCSLALDASDFPAMSYYDSRNQDLKFARWDGTEWSTETVDAPGEVGRYSSLAFNPAGNPGISYYDKTHGELKCAFRDGSSWNIETVDTENDSGEYSSLAFDSNGNPAISYAMRSGSVPTMTKFARRLGTTWSIEVVEWGASGAGEHTSLAFDPSGNPAIAYRLNNSDVRYARWTGSVWIFKTVDTASNAGEYLSLVFDSSGHPTLSYKNAANDLQYAHWDGAAWRIETVSPGNVSQCTSLAFDSSGRPVIGYLSFRQTLWVPPCRTI
jgi:hypothetical protein